MTGTSRVPIANNHYFKYNVQQFWATFGCTTRINKRTNAKLKWESDKNNRTVRVLDIRLAQKMQRKKLYVLNIDGQLKSMFKQPIL